MAAARHLANMYFPPEGLGLAEQMEIAERTALAVIEQAETTFENNIYCAVIRGETSARVAVNFENQIAEALDAAANENSA